MYVDQESSKLKLKLVIMTLLGKQILRNSIFKGCEILVKCVVLKANLIPLKMYDFNIILGMDWLFTQCASVDYFTKKVIFLKAGHSELEFEGDSKVLPMYVISNLKAKRLLHKGCEAYLAHVVDKSSLKVTLDVCR